MQDAAQHDDARRGGAGHPSGPRPAAGRAAWPLIVFSDLDGTFLDPRKEVTATNLRALDVLDARGIPFVPCSGRPATGMVPELMRHPATRYAISSNGAVVSRVDHPDAADAPALATLHATPLGKATAHEICALARGRDVTFDVFADGRCYIERRLYDRLDEFSGGDPYIAGSLRSTRTPLDEPADETIERVRVLERVSVYWKDPRDRDELLEALARMTGIGVTRSYPMNIEVMDARADKGSALAWLCGRLGLDAGGAVAFGDNINDIPMIEAAGTGVAVGNAEPEVRAAADAVCGGNGASGVGTWLLGALGA